VSNDSPSRRSLGGRSFHRRGPASEKLLSPSLLCACAVRADSTIHWNPTAAGDVRHTTAGSNHQRGMQESLEQVTGGRVLQP